MQKDQTRFENALNSLNSWVCENLPNSKYVYRELQGDLWTGFDDSPKCVINWSSPKQVIPLLQELGFNLETFDKKTKEKKLSVGAEIIESQKDKSKIAPYYLAYKAAEKVVGTYGENVKGIFFFDVNSNYIEWNGNYLYSDVPMEIDDPIIRYVGEH